METRDLIEVIDLDAEKRRLEKLREIPLPNGRMMPTAEETAWMNEEERELVEWFDRGEYATFFKLSFLASEAVQDSWIIRYCRFCCIADNLDGIQNWVYEWEYDSSNEPNPAFDNIRCPCKEIDVYEQLRSPTSGRRRKRGTAARRTRSHSYTNMIALPRSRWIPLTPPTSPPGWRGRGSGIGNPPKPGVRQGSRITPGFC